MGRVSPDISLDLPNVKRGMSLMVRLVSNLVENTEIEFHQTYFLFINLIFVDVN